MPMWLAAKKSPVILCSPQTLPPNPSSPLYRITLGGTLLFFSAFRPSMAHPKVSGLCVSVCGQFHGGVTIDKLVSRDTF